MVHPCHRLPYHGAIHHIDAMLLPEYGVFIQMLVYFNQIGFLIKVSAKSPS
jgi:hypothetical protein